MNPRRRQFIRAGLAMAAAATVPSCRAAGRNFTIAFVPGSIGIEADQGRSIELASKHGFESVEPFGMQLLKDGSGRYVDALKAADLQWAAARLTVSLRADAAAFQEGLEELPAVARALRGAGVTRVGTAVSSYSQELNYLDNFKLHTKRLREVGTVLEDQGLRLGLEYLGTKRLWTASRHAFVHSMAECLQLIGEAGKSNIGVVIDSWHWWTARETAEDITKLTNSQVVSADLNDAPAGIEREDQYDNQRELPATTGMIDARAFLDALLRIGYDGPVRAEPFNQRLNEMDDDKACQATVAAMKKAFDLVG
ncbi:MAG: sugar phosphate isomerase/epimerase [Acidobacteriia bacterium]|nr:sugar phosphate isomerase/epimerase [Terriglobia bacterium]